MQAPAATGSLDRDPGEPPGAGAPEPAAGRGAVPLAQTRVELGTISACSGESTI